MIEFWELAERLPVKALWEPNFKFQISIFNQHISTF